MALAYETVFCPRADTIKHGQQLQTARMPISYDRLPSSHTFKIIGIADHLSYLSVLSSLPFRFLVGSDRKLFMVHSALIAHHSEPLGILVNGSMSEAKEGCATLEDVDERTFLRFSQYAYTGDYTAADPDILLDSSTIPSPHLAANEASIKGDGEELPLAPSDEFSHPSVPTDPNTDPYEPTVANDINNWGWTSSSIPKKDKKRAKGRSRWSDKEEDLVPQSPQSKGSKLWDDFKNKTYATSMPTFQPRKNHESCEDYTEVFLCHARLYVFADKYDVGPLRDLSLHKLQRTLAEFTWYDQRVGDIIHLMRYSYSNTTDHPGSVDNLRSLVVHYSACVVEELWQSAEFRLLLEEFSSLGRDLIEQMLKRLD